MSRWIPLFAGQASLSQYLSQHPEAHLIWIGYRIFKWLLLLTLLVLVGLAVYAALTYPTDAEIRSLIPANMPAQDVTATIRDVRGAWLVGVKELGQYFLLTPIFPLMSAVVGYIFGRSHAVATPDSQIQLRQRSAEDPTEEQE